MREQFYLWGAPCREVQAEQAALAMRGYTVNTLADAMGQEGGHFSPRLKKRLRACAMLQAAAVVVDGSTPLEDLAACRALCKELGVAMIYSTDLPAECPPRDRIIEVIDSLDRSHERCNVRLIQPQGMLALFQPTTTPR